MASTEQDPRIAYADIIHLPHWQSPTHPRMSLHDRAAQFSSYKALSGYEDMVVEEARLTDEERRLEEEDLEKLDRKLRLIANDIRNGGHPLISFTVFVPDERKSGGRYEVIEDNVARIDAVARKIVLAGKQEGRHMRKTISFDKIHGIGGDLVKEIDEGWQ